MAQKCYRKPGSNPPVCGIDGAQLLETHTSQSNPAERHFTCPKSGQAFKETIAPRTVAPTLPQLQSAQDALVAKRWLRENDYRDASEAEKPAIQKDIEDLTQQIDKVEAAILNFRPASSQA
jgi:hypothetical protein